MKSQKWRGKLADKTLTLGDFEDALLEWDGQVEELQVKVDNAEGTVEELKAELAIPPAWGNCRRGCPPAYLNKNGFCSPACELGAPRGEFVTAPKIVKRTRYIQPWELEI